MIWQPCEALFDVGMKRIQGHWIGAVVIQKESRNFEMEKEWEVLV